ncbi:MAG: ABC transporter permease [Anaerolineales bacterium]|nr:ABC transporter permease [Anaerolineales bacterium]MCB0011649.1 ABC transporter permease [Anaerolineales bacterium]MCB0016563.1 ABC transporter permease [Anaerolineales bacterium]MCB0026341.1 ABC transporter permease [Anaerolineales bacterium]MCB8962655.1 ABC transporter permease [Ardenticatenales bacterium]
MTTYLIRRLLQSIPTMLGITVLSFFMMQAAPADPVDLMTFAPGTKVEDKIALAESLCLDRSPVEQYFVWMFGSANCKTNGIIRGDFGQSFRNRQPVIDLILERIPATLELTVWAMVIGVTIGLLIGVLSAVLHRSMFDNLARFFSVVGDAIPAFWLGLMLILLFAVQLGWLPAGGRIPLRDNDITIFDRAKHLILPSFVLAISWIAVMSRYMRAETLEVIRREYVRTAKAKGLSSRQVYFKHAARNALIPIVTFLGPGILGLIGGAVVIEQIFSWPGIGRLTLSAVTALDYPLVMGGVIFGALLVIAGNLLSDFLLVLVDPRIRLE